MTISAAFFAAWLALTYVREVPHDGYPRLGKGSMPLSAEVQPERSAPTQAVAAAARPVDEETAIEVALAD